MFWKTAVVPKVVRARNRISTWDQCMIGLARRPPSKYQFVKHDSSSLEEKK